MYNLQLQIKGNLIYINDIMVISRSSRLQLKIFHILFAQFLYDIKDGLPTDRYTFLNLEQLAERLGINTQTIYDLERKVRRPLNRMRRAIKDQLAKSGISIDNNDIIECSGWPGYFHKQSGYRINPHYCKIFFIKT